MQTAVRLEDLMWELDKRGIKLTTDGTKLYLESNESKVDPLQVVADLHDEITRYKEALMDIAAQRA